MPTAFVSPESRGREFRPTWASRFAEDSRFAGLLLAASSLLFAVLQSVCTFFAALDGLRVVIGIGSLALASGTASVIDRFHVDWLRIPMIWLALSGAVLNFVVLWQVRRLRASPAAHWRRRPVSKSRRRMERLQAALSILTLVLLALEERQHLIWLRHW
jgi:hypothetical protein